MQGRLLYRISHSDRAKVRRAPSWTVRRRQERLLKTFQIEVESLTELVHVQLVDELLRIILVVVDGKIAEEDIPVIKILTSELIAPFCFNFVYELNKDTPSLAIHVVNTYNGYQINWGYHSFKYDQIFYDLNSGFHFINGYKITLRNNWRFFHAVIPKGHKYYVNEIGECVSESLRILKQYDDDEIIDDLSTVKLLVSPNVVKNYNDCTKDEIKNAVGICIDNDEANEYRFLMIDYPPNNQNIIAYWNNNIIHNGTRLLLKKYFDFEILEYGWMYEDFSHSLNPLFKKGLKVWAPSFCNEKMEIWRNKKEIKD